MTHWKKTQEGLSRRGISPIDPRDFLEWQDILHSRSGEMDRIGVGYGQGGALLYYLLLGNACTNTKSNGYIVETTEVVFDKISDGRFNYPDLVEFYFILRAFSEDFPKNLDLTDLATDVNAMLYFLTERMIREQLLQPYLGAFNFGYVSMSLGDNHKLVGKLTDLLIEQIAKHDCLEDMFMHWIPGKQLNITHGVAFYLFFLSIALKKAVISCDRHNHILKKLTDLLVQQIGHDRCHFKACWNADTLARSMDISYGTLGFLSALIAANHCLQDTFVEDKIKHVLSQIDVSVGSNGFGLLNGYCGVLAFFEANGKYATPRVSQKIREGYQAELKLTKQAIYARDSPLQDNFYYGITGALSMLLPKSTGKNNKLNSLLLLS